MTDLANTAATFSFDAATAALVRLAARIAGGSEIDVRDALRETHDTATPAVWVEELVLQSYLFCGFPRALNAAREWRRAEGPRREPFQVQGKGPFQVQGKGHGGVQGSETGESLSPSSFQSAGEATCARVYGRFYERLRGNIADLHPEFDQWMIVEGYGKVLSRPGLDLGRRELCIIAACVASGQDRQLHSHLHGARNVGVADAVIGQSIEALDGTVDAGNLSRARALWLKVRGQ